MRFAFAACLLASGCAPAATPAEPEMAPKPPSATGWTDLETAKASGKPVFLLFTSGGDETCESFDSEVLGDAEVAIMLKHFACVRRDAYGKGQRDAEFTRLGLASVPAMAFYVKGAVVDLKDYAPRKLDFMKLLDDVLERAK